MAGQIRSFLLLLLLFFFLRELLVYGRLPSGKGKV
jgi:hypothetical protein